MKSYAMEVRNAIVREDSLSGEKDCCRLSSLSGYALSCGTVTLLGGGALRLTMRSEHPGIVRFLVKRLRMLSISTGIRIEDAKRLGGRRAYALFIEREDAKALADTLGIDALDKKIPKALTQRKCCRDAFLRGFFLGSGTISDPSREFRLEFVLEDSRMAGKLARFLKGHYGVLAGVSERRGKWVVYTNDADSIIAILSRIGAHFAILDLENNRILRDARNRANRAANCDAANIGKILSAAQRQQAAIDKIDRTIGLAALPEPLVEVAQERRSNPDISLEELGERLSPPASKSGVYHRLRRVEAIARSIEESF